MIETNQPIWLVQMALNQQLKVYVRHGVGGDWYIYTLDDVWPATGTELG